MTAACAVCGTEFGEPIYRSGSAESLTSLCTVRPHATVVYACASCGHLQTPPLDDLERYYSTDYRILVESEEEDQLYAVRDGRQVFRAEHQVATLLARAALPPSARVLDYGAAKGATMRRLMAARPDIQPHLFDVSDMYRPFWERFVPPGSFATRELPERWAVSFDAVMSFFMLEHVERPVEVLAAMLSLLKPGGLLYLLVPNPTVNIADFVVVDHVNHFTESSLEQALVDSGADTVTLDPQAHDGAWVAAGRRPRSASAPRTGGRTSTVSLAEARKLAAYWQGIGQRIREAERSVNGCRAAVYGAGFYGAFIRSRLENPEQILAYVDQNPYLQGTERFGRPVVAPDELDPEVSDVYVGLNPRVARSVIAGVTAWSGRNLRFHYL